MSEQVSPSETRDLEFSEVESLYRNPESRRRLLIEAADALLKSPNGSLVRASALQDLVLYIVGLEQIADQEPAARTSNGRVPFGAFNLESLGEILGAVAGAAPAFRPQIDALREAFGLSSFRDQVAMHVLGGMVVDPRDDQPGAFAEIARCAYRAADALIAAKGGAR